MSDSINGRHENKQSVLRSHEMAVNQSLIIFFLPAFNAFAYKIVVISPRERPFWVIIIGVVTEKTKRTCTKTSDFGPICKWS